MEFCDQCQNLMYPFSLQGSLNFHCKTCQVSSLGPNPLVYKHKFINVENIDAKMPNRNMILDPTLPRAKELACKACGQGAPVYFQPSEESMQLIYACRNPQCGKIGKLPDFQNVGAQ